MLIKIENNNVLTLCITFQHKHTITGMSSISRLGFISNTNLLGLRSNIRRSVAILSNKQSTNLPPVQTIDVQKDTNTRSIVGWQEMPKALIIPYQKNLQQNDMAKKIESVGYNTNEAKWIVAIINAYNKGFPTDKLLEFSDVDKCGHSGGSFSYSKTIANSIRTLGFEKWKNNCAHLSFKDMLEFFYFPGCAQLGNDLLSHSFESSVEKEALEKIRKTFSTATREDKIKLLRNLMITAGFN